MLANPALVLAACPSPSSARPTSTSRRTITVISDAPPRCLSGLVSAGMLLNVLPTSRAVAVASPQNGTVLVIDGRAKNALGIVRRARVAAGSLPILFLAPSVADVIAAVAAGANDFALLSSSPAVVTVRCQMLANGCVRPVSRLRNLGSLQLDRRARTLSNGTRTVTLSPIELKLLERLLLDAGTPVSRNELRRSIWHREEIATHPTNIAVVYVSYLRKKLASFGGVCTIRTITNEGYLLEFAPAQPPRRVATSLGTRRAAI